MASATAFPPATSLQSSSFEGLYQALDRNKKEVRLLLIKHGARDHALQCGFRQGFLNWGVKPEYETISYCWGNANLTSNLILDGRTISVPTSAEAALRQIRRPDEDRIVWIDSLCINQPDPDEREHQVGMMTAIYSNGQRNLIWLGAADGTTAVTLDALAAIVREIGEETNGFQSLFSTLFNPNGSRRASERPLGVKCNLKQMLDFFGRPWFGRLWVVQEAALSSRNICVCGDLEFSLQDAVLAAAWLRYKRGTLGYDLYHFPGLRGAADMFEFVFKGDQQNGQFASAFDTSLANLLNVLQDFNATDARDYVFGVLGLYLKLNDIGSPPKLISARYTKSLAHVLRDATRYMIEERQDLYVFRFLDQSWQGRERHMDTPSWVPMWHLGRDTEENPPALARFHTADGSTKVRLSPEPHSNPDVLSLHGFVLDRVSYQSDIVQRNVDSVLQLLKEIPSLFKKAGVTHDASAVGRTLIANQSFQRQPATAEEIRAYLAWSDFIIANGDFPPARHDLKHHDSLWDISEYHIAFMNCSGQRRMFATTTKLIGVGPQPMSPGDVVAVLYGCRWPVVLHPEGEYFYIRGVCYVDGLMCGEFMQKQGNRGQDDFVFHIC